MDSIDMYWVGEVWMQNKFKAMWDGVERNSVLVTEIFEKPVRYIYIYIFFGNIRWAVKYVYEDIFEMGIIEGSSVCKYLNW